jgi:PAS domain S-box-containing protein
MKDQNKTKKQLISELMELRQRITELEALENKSSQAEEALRQSEARYRTLFEDSRDAVYITTLGGKVIDVNKAFLDLLGYTKGELAGITSQDTYVNSYDRQRFQKEIEQKGFVRDFEVKLRKKDNTVIDCLITSSLWLDNGGNILGYQGIIRDITERKRTENALRESEKRYRALFEGSRDAIYVTTREGEIVDANQSMLDLFGYCREEIIGLNARRTYVYPEARRKFQQQIEREGFVRNYEIKLCKKDGTEMECLLTATVRRADDGGIFGYQGIIRDVTEHKQILNELRTEKQRFQTLSENAPFGMVMIDKDGAFKHINPRFRELFGYDLNDIPDGKTWFRKAYPDSHYRHDVISAWKEDLKIFKPGEKRSRVFTVNCKDGTEKIINFIPVQLETVENLMACEDITERKKAETALRKSEEKYRTILHGIEDFYYEVNLTGDMIFFNDSMVKISGYSEEELMGMNYRKYVSEETAKKVYQTFNQVYRTGVPSKGFDWEVIRKDGTQRFLEISVSLMHDPKGQPVGFFGIGRDVTERKQAERELKEREQKYESILNNIEELYYEVDLAGTLTFLNGSMTRILGYSREELMGVNNRQYMSEETAKRVYQTFNQVYLTGIPTKAFDWGLIRKDGTIRVLETSISLMHDPKGQPVGFFGIGRDITERKQAEEQERNLRSAKDKVLHHLSHELRTPLSVIQGSIRILKRKTQAQTPPIVRGEIFDSLEKNLGRLSDIQQETDKIIRSYREMEKSSHLEALDIPPSAGVERISLYSFAQKVLGEVKEEASHRDIQITFEGAKDLTLDANPGVLGGMFIGLLKNAIENTPDEGVIRIVLEQKAQWIQLKFMDFGIGITKENQRRLFDGLFHTLDTELYRTKKPYDFGAGGKGLDLLRTKVYSKRFGFDISVASQRCLYLTTDRDLCPGRISKCPHCRAREDCFNSGGSTFSLTFTVAGG